MSPSRPRFVTYYRVSTKRQGRSGLGLEAQRASVQAYLDGHGGRELASFTEVESGKIDSRPQLEAAIRHCELTRSTLLVAKLDRLSRDTHFLTGLQKRPNLKFCALDLPDFSNLTLSLFAAIAQHEREAISARTKAALAARRARGKPLGTPRDLSRWQRSASAKGGATMRARAKDFAERVRDSIAQARAAGHTTLQGIAGHLNTGEIQTARGSTWTPAAVSRVLDKL